MATLLIVDDDNLIRETLHELLSGAHECHTADRAEQALAFLDVETYDVVLTDLTMPGLNGRELLRYVQAKHTNTPVIVISGDIDEGKANEMMNAGAFAYFAKPFNLDDIELAVIRAISRRQELTGQQPEQPQSSPADTGAAK
ncbi:MAG TPA: response regulator [Pyrinomonadaceae bacterium]|jgi:DNA-binding NtrC family response regulator